MPRSDRDSLSHHHMPQNLGYFYKQHIDNRHSRRLSLPLSLDTISLDTIYTNDVETLKIIVERISHVWNVETAHGTNYLLNEM